MEEGYVYILSNDSLNGLLKIGSTTFGAEKGLSSYLIRLLFQVRLL